MNVRPLPGSLIADIMMMPTRFLIDLFFGHTNLRSRPLSQQFNQKLHAEIFLLMNVQVVSEIYEELSRRRAEASLLIFWTLLTIWSYI